VCLVEVIVFKRMKCPDKSVVVVAAAVVVGCLLCVVISLMAVSFVCCHVSLFLR